MATGPEIADDALLKRWRLGDRSAGEQLIDRHSDAIYRFLSSKTADGAEDLMQQVFLALLEGSQRFQGRSSLRTYLFSIARRQLYNFYRERRRNPGLDFTVSTLAELCTSPSGVVARAQSHELLHLALKSLPVDHQVALELLYWENMRPSEIAEVLEISVSTAYARVRQARERLRLALGELDPELGGDQDAEQLLERAAPTANR